MALDMDKPFDPTTLNDTFARWNAIANRNGYPLLTPHEIRKRLAPQQPAPRPPSPTSSELHRSYFEFRLGLGPIKAELVPERLHTNRELMFVTAEGAAARRRNAHNRSKSSRQDPRLLMSSVSDDNDGNDVDTENKKKRVQASTDFRKLNCLEAEEAYARIKSFAENNSIIYDLNDKDMSSDDLTPLANSTRALKINKRSEGTPSEESLFNPSSFLESTQNLDIIKSDNEVTTSSLSMCRSLYRASYSVVAPASCLITAFNALNATANGNHHRDDSDNDSISDSASYTGAEFVGPNTNPEEHFAAPPMVTPRVITNTDKEVAKDRLLRVNQFVLSQIKCDPVAEYQSHNSRMLGWVREQSH